MVRVWIMHTESAVFIVPTSMIRFTGTAGIMILSIMIPGIILPGIHHTGHTQWDGEAAGTLPTIAGDGEAIILHIITAHGIVLITLIMAGDIPIIHGMDMAIFGILIQKITGTDKDVPPIQV